MKASKFSEAQKAFILEQGADGVTVADICRKAVIRSHSLDRRKVEFPACFTAAGWLRRRGSATRSEAYGRSPRADAPRCSI